jgi:hypothetical protein
MPKKKPAKNSTAQPPTGGATKPAAAPAPPNAASTPPGSAATPLAADAAILAKDKQDLQQLRDTTLNLIKLLVQEGVLTQQKAEALVREAERSAITPLEVKPAAPKSAISSQAQAPPGAAVEPKLATDSKVVRVPYVPEMVKNEIRDQVKQEVIAQAKAEHWAEPNALPEWLDRIAFEGDLRFRYQGNFYQDSNTPTVVYNAITGSNLNNTTNDETWWRIRARLGVLANLSPEWNAKVSIATGNAQSPISLNQDTANYFSGYSVQLDNAYVRYDPKDWLSGTLGRMPKPFFSSELVWWDDLVMDGIAATARPQLAPGVRGFLTGGGFLIQNPQSTPVTPDPKSKYLLALQGGTDWDINRNTRLKLGLAYYDFEHVEGQRNTTASPDEFDWTVPKFTQKGNSLFDINFGTGNPSQFALASKFKEINLTGALDLMHLDPYLVRISGDYVKNIAFDQQDVLARTGLSIQPRTTGYQGQIQFGSPELKAFRDWQVFLTYRYLQRDAVMDAFNDPDFHLGGTDTRGYALGLRYALGSNAWLRLRWMSADEIDGPPLAIDVLQLDFNAKF